MDQTKKITAQFGSGIEEELVENSGEFQELVKSFICCICLEIVKLPMQCEKCESLYCSECWDIIKTAGKNCVLNCPASNIKRANKFVLELLKQVSLRCEMCFKRNIDYHTFIKHIEGCSLNMKYSSKVEIERIIKEKDTKIESLKNELKAIKQKSDEKKKEHEELKRQQQSSHNTTTDPEKLKVRERFITHKLNTTQKMELYKATIEGRIYDFKQMVIQKGFPILEEVSAQNYYWTPLHYAMHYGQLEIVLFCFEVLKTNNCLNQAMMLESNDGRCPILCLLRSNSLNNEKKKEFMEKLLKMYHFSVSDAAKKEMKKRGMESLLS